MCELTSCTLCYSPDSKGWVLSPSLVHPEPLLHSGAELSIVIATSHMWSSRFKLNKIKYNLKLSCPVTLAIFQIVNNPMWLSGYHAGKHRCRTFLSSQKVQPDRTALKGISGSLLPFGLTSNPLNSRPHFGFYETSFYASKENQHIDDPSSLLTPKILPQSFVLGTAA